MRASLVHAFDAPPRYGTFADPIAGAEEVLIDVTAAGLHPVVKALASGIHYGSEGPLPFVPGVDGVGRLQDGTRVYFGMIRSPFGTFAERSVTAPWMCVPLPNGLDDATAAGIANPGMSSWAALSLRAHLVPGENVLILGATGVAGKLAVQVAKRLGARRVVAAGRNHHALNKLPALGADQTISLNQEHSALVAGFRQALSGDGIDVVLDYLWGQPAECLLEAISQKGTKLGAARTRFIQVGESAGGAISLPASTLRSSGLELLGSGFGSASLKEIMKAVGEFLRDAAREPFQIEIRTAPLRDVESLWNSESEGKRLVFEP